MFLALTKSKADSGEENDIHDVLAHSLVSAMYSGESTGLPLLWPGIGPPDPTLYVG